MTAPCSAWCRPGEGVHVIVGLAARKNDPFPTGGVFGIAADSPGGQCVRGREVLVLRDLGVAETPVWDDNYAEARLTEVRVLR